MRGGSNQNMKRMIIGTNGRRNWNEKLEGNGRGWKGWRKLEMKPTEVFPVPLPFEAVSFRNRVELG